MVLALLPLLAAKLWAQEHYAVLSYNAEQSDNAVLTFYYDDQKEARGGMSVGPFSRYDEVSWFNQRADITSVVFDDSFANDNTLTSTAYWFLDFEKLTSITGIGNLNTANVTTMSNMFQECYSLTSLDVSNFNTAKVENMNGMFIRCGALTSLDLSSFNTANVTNMNSMFFNCTSLTTIQVGSAWSTGKVIYGQAMFEDCTALVGGKGTTYDASHTDYTYAHIDGGTSNPGYFTDKNAPVDAVGEATFDGLVATVSGERTLDEAFASVGGRAEAAKTIAAVVWDKATVLTDEMLQGITNPNLLVYVSADSLAPRSINNVIVDGVAERITLTDATEGNANFYCPQTFTARSISYSREFTQQTEVGVSRGWETLSLPFTVQRITHERNGALHPFGSGTQGKPFWLRQMTAAGLTGATRIEANTPYLLSMPNNSQYSEEYNQAGRVTFSATAVRVYATQPTGVEAADITLVPTFQRVAQSDSVYVLNSHATYGGYAEGSVFVSGLRGVRPFEAYTAHHSAGAPLYILLDDLLTGIDEVTAALGQTGDWYDLGGRRLNGRPTAKGVYIIDRKKVVVE